MTVKSGLITMVVQEVGATTRRLGALEEGEEILDMVGPLGRGARNSLPAATLSAWAAATALRRCCA